MRERPARDAPARGHRRLQPRRHGGGAGRLDPEIEVFTPPELGNAGTFHGHAGYLTWVESWLDAWEEFRIEPVEIEQFGDDFLVLMDAGGRGKGSGAEVSLRFWWLYTVPVDRATRLHLYLDRETALEALA